MLIFETQHLLCGLTKMQHIDDENTETEINGYDPHNPHSMIKHIAKQDVIIFAMGVVIAVMSFLLGIFFYARLNGVYCL